MMLSPLALLALAPFAAMVQAAIPDMSSVAEAIYAEADYSFGGEYTVYNAALDKYMYFGRIKDGSVSLQLSSAKQTVFIDTVKSGGDSGTSKGLQGIVISDGMTKCASTAWNFNYSARGTARVEDFIPYSCALGPYKSRSDATIVDAKQLMQAVPCGGASSDDDDDDDDNDDDNEDDDDVVDVAVNVNLAAIKKTTSTAKTTGTCRKPYDWVCRHQEYVDMQPACAPALKTCNASKKVKRSHSEMAANLKKRGSSGTYCLIASDHILDMATIAVTNTYMYSFSDIYGLHLDFLDRNDVNQQWVITSV